MDIDIDIDIDLDLPTSTQDAAVDRQADLIWAHEENHVCPSLECMSERR